MNQRKLNFSLVWILLVILFASVMGCNLRQSAVENGSEATPPKTIVSINHTKVTATAMGTPSPTATGTASPTDQPGSTATVAHLVKPGEPPQGFESQPYDLDSSGMASQQRVMGGDIFAQDIFERPFDQSMMTYFAGLDIKLAGLNRDATWTYATLSLAGPPAQGGLAGDYGLEIDVDRDGRGDFLIQAAAPGAGWSTNGVSVRQDKNQDVGGKTPIQSDPSLQTGDGYETLLFNGGQGSDPDLGWARISPGDPSSVQIAFKRALFNDGNPYMWGAWAMDASMFHADWFDYNDHFSLTQAGSPLGGNADYPLKAFYAVDNTCRWAVGFTPTGNEPGICPVAQATQAFTLTPSPTPIPTYTLLSRCFAGSTTNPCPTAVTTTTGLVQVPTSIAKLPTSNAKLPSVITRTPTRTPTPAQAVVKICVNPCK